MKKGEEPAGSVRLGGAQPEHRTRLSGLNGLGVGEKKKRKNKISANDF